MVDILHVDSGLNDFLGGALSPRKLRKLSSAAKRLDSILAKNNQSLKISIGRWTMVVGSTHDSYDLPELVFENYSDCFRALKKCRLFNIANLFFAEKIRVAGSIDSLVDILYSINIANDVPQSLEEKFFFFAFRRLKEWVPVFAKRFESDFHYSLDARAYELFLDQYLQYTCGRVTNTTQSIDDAQVEKFKLIADWAYEQIGSLRDKRHLDVGCGWGGLISYFENSYEMKSTGVTNCAAQRDYISSRFGAKTVLGDFTTIGQFSERFDLVTVVGMSEHVVGGLKDRLLENIRDSLSDDGVLYFQTITKPDQWIGGDAYRIVQELIFPGHDLDTQAEAERRFVAAGFEIVHAENHAADYAYTTGQWAKKANQNLPKLKALIGTKNANLFVMYLLYASKLFGTGRGKLMRYALTKSDNRGNRAMC